MAMCRLASKDLSCARGGRLLFREVNFALGPGEALHVTGPNGVGKSSLIRVLAGLLPPFSGSVDVEGAWELADEHPALDMHWTLAVALGFWARLDGASSDAVTHAMKRLDLNDLADVPLRMFSTGQRKRAALARIFVSGASIWMMDEPTNGLDSGSTGLLGKAMRDHLERGGIIVAASHLGLPLSGMQVLPLEEYSG